MVEFSIHGKYGTHKMLCVQPVSIHTGSFTANKLADKIPKTAFSLLTRVFRRCPLRAAPSPDKHHLPISKSSSQSADVSHYNTG